LRLSGRPVFQSRISTSPWCREAKSGTAYTFVPSNWKLSSVSIGSHSLGSVSRMIPNAGEVKKLRTDVPTLPAMRTRNSRSGCGP